MQTLEQIAYDTGRSALADQESLVAGIRQRTGTLYDELHEQAASAARNHEKLDGLAAAGFAHQALHDENAPRVRRMSRLSGLLAALMVSQTLAWLAALVVQ